MTTVRCGEGGRHRVVGERPRLALVLEYIHQGRWPQSLRGGQS
jgi:hypothetical protein